MAKLILLAVLLAISASEAYKILVIFPLAGKSHGILGEGYIRNLVNAGHEVTGLVAFRSKEPHPNLTEVIAESAHLIFNENSFNIKSIMDKDMDFQDNGMLLEFMYQISKTTIEDENVQKLLNDPKQKFDAIIAEWMFTDIYSTLAAIYDCPLIWSLSLEPHWMALRLIDETMNPAYYPDFKSSHIAPYSFSARVEQLWSQINGAMIIQRFSEQEKQLYLNTIAPILRKRGKPVPDYEEMIYNASLMLGNSHVSLGMAPRLPQSYKPIGGYHIDANINPLPTDLKKLLENSKYGVIYFSMGSNIKSKDMPQTMKDSILKVFSDLKQTVLWKFEEVLPDLPKNVHIIKWAPQQSILAHPNCILFITHGGLLSITEALHYGKPIIGVPVFADQFSNIERAVYKGFGRRVDLSYDMSVQLEIELKEILGNPKYAQKAKEWSFIYHDRPVKPAQELVHWVEHVIKTGGARHLRSVALLVPWYQKLYLDLLALIILGVIVTIVAVKLLLGWATSASRRIESKKNK